MPGYGHYDTLNAGTVNTGNFAASSGTVRGSLQANALNTHNNIYYEIQQAFYTMIEKKNSIPVSFLGLKQAKENYELSYGRYKVGVGNPVELKEAQVQYQDAMLRYYNSLYQFNTARADLEKFIGKNLAEDEVKLDIEDGKKNSKKKSKKNS